MENTALINKRTLYAALTIFTAVILFLSGVPGFVTPAAGISAQEKENAVQRILPKDLKGMLDKKEAVLIVDVRPVSAFNTQHIEGAISVPLNEISSRLDELPRDKTIAFY